MIDKELFPEEYAAIERLKETSRKIEEARHTKKQNKLKKIDKYRRMLNEEHSE